MIDGATIARTIRELPPLPSSVAELGRLVQDPDASAADFERVIKSDPSLTSSLLRMANMPLFGVAREVGTVRRAVGILGVRRVFELATAAAFTQVIPRRLEGYDVDSVEFWRHCVAVAVLAERLALERALRPPELVFTAGLLHDIGKLAVSTWLGESEQGALSDHMDGASMSLFEAERATLGADHAQVGVSLADAWGLPDVIVLACRWHHEPSAAPEPCPVLDLVHVADCLAHVLGFTSDIGGLHRDLDERALTRLALDDDCIDRAIARGAEAVSYMTDHFGGGA